MSEVLEVEVPAELEIQPEVVAPLEGSARFDDIAARISTDPASVTDEELDWAEKFDPKAAPVPEVQPELETKPDPIAEAMRLVGAKDPSELGAKVAELRGKVGSMGDEHRRALEEVQAKAQAREQHERFVSALAAGDPQAWAALEKIRPGSIAAAKPQAPAEEEEVPDDVIDVKAWRASQQVAKENAALREEMRQLAEWRTAQQTQQQQLVQHEAATNKTLSTVAQLAVARPELADPNLTREIEAYMWSQPGQEPALGDSARTIIAAMELGQALKIEKLADAYDAYCRLYPNKVKVANPAQSMQSSAQAPKQPLPGLAGVRAKGPGGADAAYSDAEILAGNFPDHWINKDGSPNYSAIPQQYHNMF